MDYEIRLLTSKDSVDYRQLRLHALKNFPTYYGTSYDEALEKTDASYVQMIEKYDIFGVYLNQEISAIAMFAQAEGKHTEHFGNIYQVYVHKDKQNLSIGSKLMGAVIEHAKTKVQQIYICVSAHNKAAIALYKKFDFEIYGTEPKSLYIDNNYYDEHLMVKFLK